MYYKSQQLKRELEILDAGTKKTIEKMELAKKRDEGTTTSGMGILRDLHLHFQGMVDSFCDAQFLLITKHTVFREVIKPACEQWEQLDKLQKRYLSEPKEVLAFTVAKEIVRHMSRGVKLTTVGKTTLDVLCQTYNVPCEDGTLTGMIALIRGMVESHPDLRLISGDRGSLTIMFSEEILAKHTNNFSAILPKISFEPMIVQPIDHSSLTSAGGYLKVYSPLIKGFKGDDSEFDIDLINKLQRTAYTIDNELVEMFEELGLLDFEVDPDIQSKVREKRQKAKRLRWTGSKSDEFTKGICSHQAATLEAEADSDLSEAGKLDSMKRTVDLIQKYKQYESIWFPLFCDTRGRIYTYCTDLSVQGNKLSRAVLHFSEKKLVDNEGYKWLLVKLGSLAGADKMVYEKRLEAGLVLEGLVDSFFEDGDMTIFDHCSDQDEIYDFVSVIKEIYGYRSSDEYYSGYIYYIDSVNSGAQICSLLTRSKEGAVSSNLVNPEGDRLTDGYLGVVSALKKEYEVISGQREDEIISALDQYFIDEMLKVM